MQISKRNPKKIMQLKEAIVASFAVAETEVRDLLDRYGQDEWNRVLWWLDISGMALYFLGRIRSAGACASVPPSVLTALEDRQARNSLRNRALMKEASILCGWFNDADLSYALLKGISLAPDSVPDPALRCQADLDFLVPRKALRLARHYVSRLGYVLQADTGRTLELRAGSAGRPNITQIYSVHSQRALELHVTEDHCALLARRRTRIVEGIRLESLSPADILVHQATHLLKHFCGEHTRLAWILEYRRHMEARRGDANFWSEVESVAAATRNGDLAMSVALWLSRELFGPGETTAGTWTETCPPERIKLWLQLYARPSLFSDAIASKRYALLRNELEIAPGGARSVRSIFFPSRLPARIMEPSPNEELKDRLQRYSIEAKHFLTRLRFHVVEGARLAIDSMRWRRAVSGLDKPGIAEHLNTSRSAPRAGCASLLLALCGLVCPVHGNTQAMTNPGIAVSDAPSGQSDLGTNQPQQVDQSASGAMPAADLIQLARSNPDMMVEIKSFVSDFLQRQNTPITTEPLSDDQVYSAIDSSQELRKGLTQYLRARGYVSEEQIDAAILRDQNASLTDSGHRFQENDMGVGGFTQRANPRASSFEDEELQGFRKPDESQLPRRTEATESTQNRPSAVSPNVTDEPRVLRRAAPYNLLSLRDLYTQVPDTSEHLKRFGSDVFTVRGASGNSNSVLNRESGMGAADVPVGPDYVLGPGDELSISVWGGVSENLLRVVEREGGVALPEAGLVQVAGLTMEKAEGIIQEALRPQFRNAHVAVTVARLRSIRIFVVGDVQRPGSYEISSVASPVTALYAAGGPTAVGSLRVLRHYRNEKLIGEIDLYDFMLHGMRSGGHPLQSGDTLLVPPVGTQVAVFGAVKRPAIYELSHEKTLAEVLENAGGTTVAAALAQITVDRVMANQGRVELGINANPNENPSITEGKLANFEVKDGDRVHVATVLPVNDRVIYLQGHVARPGRIAYRDNMRLTDVLRSYGDLLPEPAETGEIVRLVAPDMHPETIEFNIPDVLIGNASLTLQPFDTVRVFGRYEEDAPMVTIRGEVQRPGSYPLFEGMTSSQLVRAAGGFKRDALLSRADLTSYQIVNGNKVSVFRRDVQIGSAVLKQDRDSDIQLKPGDVLTIHQISGWNDIGAYITIDGEVGHPGAYGFQEGEHLSDVLKRAGGFRDTAYPEGAVLTRPEVAALEEKSRQELIRQIDTSASAARMSAGGASSDQPATLQLIQQQRDQVLAQLKSEPASGRLVIHISEDIESWAGTSADIEVRRGDVLKIPKRPGFVLVSGQVYNSSAITYTPHKTASWYLQRAGGPTQIANRKYIFVIRANGEVIGRRSSGWYDHDVLSTELEAGDTVVVPQKIIGPSVVWRNLLATAQVTASLAIAAAVVTGL
jgi:protein involved in polysaccharide export with SLBB domain